MAQGPESWTAWTYTDQGAVQKDLNNNPSYID